MDHRNPKDEPPIPVYRFWLGLSKLSALLSEGEEGAGNAAEAGVLQELFHQNETDESTGKLIDPLSFELLPEQAGEIYSIGKAAYSFQTMEQLWNLRATDPLSRREIDWDSFERSFTEKSPERLQKGADGATLLSWYSLSEKLEFNYKDYRTIKLMEGKTNQSSLLKCYLELTVEGKDVLNEWEHDEIYPDPTTSCVHITNSN
jgi:hypothetical protein